MRALGLKVGQLPQIIDINDLADMQKYVDGFVEYVNLEVCRGYTIDAVVNEEGKLRDLPENRPLYMNDDIVDDLCGDFFICANNLEGELIELSMQDLIKYAKMYLTDYSMNLQMLEEL